MFEYFKSSNQLNVGGKMSQQGSDLVGKMQATAWIILATGIAMSLIIFAFKS